MFLLQSTGEQEEWLIQSKIKVNVVHAGLLPLLQLLKLTMLSKTLLFVNSQNNKSLIAAIIKVLQVAMVVLPKLL